MLAARLALLLRFAEAFTAPVEPEDELPWLAWLELELLADPVPVVAVVAWLFPVVLALPPPLLDGLLNAVLLLVFEVSFLLPIEDEAEFAAAELEEPWFALLLLELAARVPAAVRLSLALTAELPELLNDDPCCPPTEALWPKVSEVPVEAPKLELSFAPCAKLSEVPVEAPIRIGVGLNHGIVQAGILGSTGRKEFTMIGDEVNVASRLEGITKEFRTDLAISESVRQLLGDSFLVRRLGFIQLKGKTQATLV